MHVTSHFYGWSQGSRELWPEGSGKFEVAFALSISWGAQGELGTCLVHFGKWSWSPQGEEVRKTLLQVYEKGGGLRHETGDTNARYRLFNFQLFFVHSFENHLYSPRWFSNTVLLEIHYTITLSLAKPLSLLHS